MFELRFFFLLRRLFPHVPLLAFVSDLYLFFPVTKTWEFFSLILRRIQLFKQKHFYLNKLILENVEVYWVLYITHKSGE